MNASDLFVAAGAVLTYGVSAGIRIELRDGRTMTTVGAFGPALVALGGSGYRIAPLPWLLAGAVGFEMIALLATRQRLRLLIAHVAALLGAAIVFAMVTAYSGVSGRKGLLLSTALSSAIYLALEAFWRDRHARPGGHSRAMERLVDAAPVHAILVSTAGLTVLGLPLLRWATFPIVLVPLLAAAVEFGNFGRTRRTFDETVSALASLVEGAGYARDGHHKRVAALCVAIGRELGLPSKQVRELELVALLHDVGAVSLPDPDSASYAGDDAVAARSAEFVEETGYLAGYGSTLRRAARGTPDDVKASILHLANLYDELQVIGPDHFRSLESTLGRVNPAVAEAFRRVIAETPEPERH